MMSTRFLRRLAPAILLASQTLPGGAGQESSGTAQPPRAYGRPGIEVELNKLEAASSACRAYFVVGNRTPEALKELRLDVFLFDKAEIVLRRVSMTFPDIRADRSKVVLFELPEVGCGEVGRFLVNDVLSCVSASEAPLPGCAGFVATSSRTGVDLAY